MQGLAYLALTAGLGLALLIAPQAEWGVSAAMAYGVFGLVGFLSQVVVGVEGRLLPLAAWLWSYAGGGFKEAPPSLHRTPVRPLQVAASRFGRPGFRCWPPASRWTGRP